MTNLNNTKNFEAGNIYEMFFYGDSDLRPQWMCGKLTAKTGTFVNIKTKEVITKKIKSYDNIQYIELGSYSMAPRISAKRIVG